MTEPAEVVRYDPREQLRRWDPDSKLLRYFELLLTENKRHNLVSRETARVDLSAGDTAARYPGLAELAVASLFPFGQFPSRPFDNYLDIGSGGGFPAIPILLLQPVGRICLVERTKKKAGALRRILLGLERSARIEPVDLDRIDFGSERFDLITMRLVRIEPRLLARITELLSDDGIFVYYARQELDFSESSLVATSFLFGPLNSSEPHSCTLLTKKLPG